MGRVDDHFEATRSSDLPVFVENFATTVQAAERHAACLNTSLDSYVYVLGS